MKEPENIYTKYNVDVNKLTRDYLKFPLKKFTKRKYEDLPKEDFVYLYIECNIPRKVLAQYFNVSSSYIDKLRSLYNVKKSYEQIFENVKKTNLKRYGVENYAQTSECYEKMKQTCLIKYGVENYTQSNEYKDLYKDEEFVNNRRQKEYETKKKNHSFGKSEEENEIYNILLTKFKEVIRQYKSKIYPFNCDFYIPEIDLYIEYQGYFTHGFEPYLGTDSQKEIIKEWENKSQKNPQYSYAIKIWTRKDVIKRNTAKQNNLNWIEFFNMEQFIKWFESI